MSKQIIITVNNQADPAPELIEAARILYNLDHHTREWQTKHGYEPRKRMEFWQAKAKQWLTSHVQQNINSNG